MVEDQHMVYCPSCGDSRIGLKIKIEAQGGLSPTMHLNKHVRSIVAYCMVCKSAVSLPQKAMNDFTAFMERSRFEEGSGEPESGEHGVG